MEENFNQGSYGQNSYVPEQPEQPEQPQVPQYEAEQPQVPQYVPEYPYEEYQPEAPAKGGFMEKVKNIPKKLWMMLGAGVAIVVALIVVLSLASNTPKSPVNAAEKLVNSKKLNQVIDRAPNLLNGFCEKEARQLIKIAKSTEMYEDAEEDAEELFAQGIELVEEILGKNYKIEFKVMDKEKIDKDDCEDFQDMLNEAGEMLSERVEELEDMDDDELEEGADQLGLKKGDIKKAIKILKSICKKVEKAKVSAGYELELKIIISGKELDDDIELELPINVWKVSGHWVPDPSPLATVDITEQDGFADLRNLVMENMDVIQEFAKEIGGMGIGGMARPSYDSYYGAVEEYPDYGY